MNRRLTSELMDDPDLSPRMHRRALGGLRRINRLSGVTASLWRPLSELARTAGGRLSLLDVAAGAADVPLALAERARREGWTLDVTACDRSPVAREVALEAATRRGLELTYLIREIEEDVLRDLGTFDVVLCTLFLHHLEADRAVGVLRGMKQIAGNLLLVNDLRRTRRHLALAHVIPRMATRSPIVHVDAVKSVRAAYSVEEFSKLATIATLHHAEIRTIFPERMILTWRPVSP